MISTTECPEIRTKQCSKRREQQGGQKGECVLHCFTGKTLRSSYSQRIVWAI